MTDFGFSRNTAIVEASKGTVWNGIGTDISDCETSAQIASKAGLTWEVSKALASYEFNGETRKADNRFITLRTDSGIDLGAVRDTWKPVQNLQVLSFFDQLRARGIDFTPMSAGALGNGEKCYALIRLNGEIAVERQSGMRDPIQPVVLALWGHDGNTGITLVEIAERLFCSNQISPLLKDGKLPLVSIRHTASAESKIRQGAAFISNVHEHFMGLRNTLQSLEDTPMNDEGFVLFANQLIFDIKASGDELRAEIAEKYKALSERESTAGLTRHENKVTDLLDRFKTGIGNEGKTRFDGLNAVTEWIDHKRIATTDSVARMRRLSSAAESGWVGDRARTKQRALRILSR